MLTTLENETADEAHPGGVPLIELNDGQRIPQLGFGVWQVPDDEVAAPVRVAIEAGYRSIDTAQGYDNEEGVGRGIRDSGIERDELFVTSKLRTRYLGLEEAQQGIEESLQKLQLDYLDMFLIHWPAPELDRYVDAWKGLIKAREAGLVRTIGVSNLLPEYIERIVSETGVPPAVNQIELHPGYQQRDVREFHDQQGIRLESYSPLGSGSLLDDRDIGDIARRHGRSPAQIILRWHLQQGLIAIPKSVTPERIRQNLEVFDFELDDYDIDVMRKLDDPKSGKTGSDPATFNDLF
jgi:2,5-diketo-D-gluconate reductase A